MAKIKIILADDFGDEETLVGAVVIPPAHDIDIFVTRDEMGIIRVKATQASPTEMSIRFEELSAALDALKTESIVAEAKQEDLRAVIRRCLEAIK